MNRKAWGACLAAVVVAAGALLLWTGGARNSARVRPSPPGLQAATLSAAAPGAAALAEERLGTAERVLPGPRPSISEPAAGRETREAPPGSAAPKPVLSGAPPLVERLTLGRAGPADSAGRERVDARSARARALDARLEGRIADLRARAAKASGSEKDALLADIGMLETNLARRRALEGTGTLPASRPGQGP